ncbi:MAG: patatin family protein [Erysipelotrichales bacterium]|nr:MAG: patatin family protein [Erysipelotrichales bacterium]
MNIGLVLEGGGLRGCYTAGVLTWLIDQGIEADTVVGISSGAMLGSYYMLKDKNALHEIGVTYASDPKNIGLQPLLHEGTPVGYRFLFETVLKKILHYDYRELQAVTRTFEFGVYSLKLQKTIWKNQHTMDNELKYMLAACTLPLAGRSVKIDGVKYLDGGITTMVPIGHAEELGASKFLVVVTKDPDFVRKPNGRVTQFLLDLLYFNYKKLLKDFRARTQVYYDEMNHVRDLQGKGQAILLQPTRDCGVKHFSGTREQMEIMFDLAKEDCENRKDEILAFFAK